MIILHDNSNLSSRELRWTWKLDRVQSGRTKALHYKYTSVYISVALFSNILFKIVILHNIKRLFFTQNPLKIWIFQKMPIWRLLFLKLLWLGKIFGWNLFSFFCIILSSSMGENILFIETVNIKSEHWTCKRKELHNQIQNAMYV